MLDLELLILALIVFKYETLLTELVQLEPFFLADFPNRSLPLFPNTLADFETLWGLDDLDFEDLVKAGSHSPTVGASVGSGVHSGHGRGSAFFSGLRVGYCVGLRVG